LFFARPSSSQIASQNAAIDAAAAAMASSATPVAVAAAVAVPPLPADPLSSSARLRLARSMNPFLLLLPDIALIAIGFALSRKVDWGEDLWPGIEKLTYYVLFPAL